MTPILFTTTLTFGPLLKHLRKQAGMTQRDLAAALGYSEALICSLEKATRQPDLQAVTARFIPALGLQDDPNTAAYLIEQAALARGERPPTSITFQRTTHMKTQTELVEALPAPPTALIGRSVEVNHLCNRLLGHRGRLLTLLGPPGIGKTTLALAVAARLQPHYPDGVVFVPLAAVSDPTLMASTILTAIGSTDLNPPKDKLIAFLRRKSLLLVLDNLEQMPDAAPLIAELVAECPDLCILATSRERLHLRAEQRYKVPPLDLASAIELFVQRAQAVDADFADTPHHQPTLEAICQRLDCLPLALELCAAQIDLLAPVQLLAHLQDHSLDLLVNGARDLPPRQRTLRSAIGYSYALLNEAERRLFRSLGVFVSGFALDAVEALATDRLASAAVQSTLHALISKSLVRAETLPSGAPRFRLLETIREFALEQAQVHGEEGELRQRHYATYLQLFRTGDSHLRGPEAATWFARLTPEQDNLRAALQWAFEEAYYADMAWLLVAGLWFWFLPGHWYEQGRWLAQLLPYRQTLEPDLHLAILVNLYAVARSLEEFQPVERWEGEVRQLLDLCSHPLLPAAALTFIAGNSYNNLSKATMAWERSIALARSASEAPPLSAAFGILADRDFRLGFSLWAYADRLVEYGQFTQVMPLLRESLAIFQARGSRYEISNCLGTLGRMALLQGDLAQAHQRLYEAVAIATEFNYHEMLGWLQAFLGLATLYHGTISDARRILIENHTFCTDLKDKGLVARNSIYLAETFLSEGLVDEAEQWLGQSSVYYADPHRIRIDQVERLLVAASLAAAQQCYRRAATLFGLVHHFDSFDSQRRDRIQINRHPERFSLL